MSTIAVIDYGMGNLRSVAKALEYVSAGRDNIVVTSSTKAVQNADKVVFPGQGAARDCMRALDSLNLRECILQAASQKPFLGVCMGMQVLMDFSEENNGTPCLGLYRGRVKHFRSLTKSAMSAEHYKIPHMGWNQVHQKNAHPLWQGIPQDSHFYFVHSYFVAPEDSSLTIGSTEYASEFTAALAHDNVFAMQCHPEKSADAGLQLLTNFIRWNGLN